MPKKVVRFGELFTGMAKEEEMEVEDEVFTIADEEGRTDSITM
jgi:cytidylate kinase